MLARSLTRMPQHKLFRSPPPRAKEESATPPAPAVDGRAAPAPKKDPKLGKFLLSGLALVGVVGGIVSQPPPPPEVITETVESIAPFDLSEISLEYEAATAAQIDAATDWAIKQSYTLTPSKPNENRHELRARVQAQDLTSTTPTESDTVHYDGSDVVVIAFEGTATFHPRKTAIVQGVAARLREQGLRSDGSHSISYRVNRALSETEGADYLWSGMSNGPLESLVEHPELSRRTQFLSFPSEELEVLSSMTAYETAGWGEIIKDATNSYVGQTPGIDGALKAVREIQQQAQEQGKNPRFVVVSHSSGGRSLVKFLEKAKSITDSEGKQLKFDALTIDPVREAHEALVEGVSEVAGQKVEETLNSVLDFVGLPERDVGPALVKHRLQPESLYAPSNVDEFLNFYQRKDLHGIGVGPEVGIQGSPVVGAVNREITNVGTGGHGQIAINETVEDAFLQLIANALSGG